MPRPLRIAIDAFWRFNDDDGWAIASHIALSGLMAALLASQEFVATQEFLSAKDGGLYVTYVDGGKPELATAELGQRWELEQIGLRLWPSGSPMQGINSVLFDLIEQHDIAHDGVRAVRIRVSPSVFGMHGDLQNYNGKFEALISAHYTAAAILRDRELTLRQYEPARYDDPALRSDASHLIAIEPDDRLQGVQATAEIELKNGEKHSGRCDYPRGSFENPLSAAQLRSKFQTYAARFKSEREINTILEMVDRLEDLPSARGLMDLLRSAKPVST